MSSCLIVDDSRVIRKVARRILEGLDHDVTEAADGVEALAVCRSAMPETVLLDWYMPVMDGLEFLQRLRATPGGQGVVVVVCSSETETARIAAALDAGADEFVMKPFDTDILQAKMEEARRYAAARTRHSQPMAAA